MTQGLYIVRVWVSGEEEFIELNDKSKWCRRVDQLNETLKPGMWVLRVGTTCTVVDIHGTVFHLVG